MRRGSFPLGEEPVRLLDLLSLSRSRNRKSRELRAVSFDNIRYVYVEGKCAAVDEREGEIALASFAFQVFFNRRIGFFSHLRGSVSLDFSQLRDTRRHFLYLEFKTCQIGFHFVILDSFGIVGIPGTENKKRPKEILFETNGMSAVPLKLRYDKRPSGSSKPYAFYVAVDGRILLTPARFLSFSLGATAITFTPRLAPIP